MNNIGCFLVLIFAFMLFGGMSFFAANVFNRLRLQNIGVFEALFLALVYSISYLFSQYSSCEDLEITRDKILKHSLPTFILILGILVIALICVIVVNIL